MKKHHVHLKVDYRKWAEVWQRSAFEQMIRADRAESELVRARAVLARIRGEVA